MKNFFGILALSLVLILGCGSNKDNNSDKTAKKKEENKEEERKDVSKKELLFVFNKVGLTAVVTPVEVISKKYSTFQIRFWPSNAIKTGSPVPMTYQLNGRTWMDMKDGNHHPGGKGKLDLKDVGSYDWTQVGFNMNSDLGTWYLILGLYDKTTLIEEVRQEIHVP